MKRDGRMAWNDEKLKIWKEYCERLLNEEIVRDGETCCERVTSKEEENGGY